MTEARTARWMSAVVAIGIVFRCWAYAVNRSLWLDELFLWAELGPSAPETLAHWTRFLQPMPTQIAAPGFVLMTQAMRALFGDAEWALRFVPFAAGVLSLVLAVRLFRRLLTPVAAIFAISVLAVSNIAIYYSSDFKPYSIDLMMALWVLDLASARLEAETPRIDLVLWGAGFVAIFVSLPAVFVLAGVGAAFLSRRALANIALAGTWAVLFVGQVLLLMSRTSEQQWLHLYWVGKNAFPPEGEGLVGFIGWAPGALVRALGTPVGFGGRWETVSISTIAAALFGVWGAVVLTRRSRRRATMFLLPVVLALVGAMLGRYPFQGRVICFVSPALMLCVALGVERLGEVFPSRRWLPVLCSALLTVESSALALWHLYAPFYREEARPVLEWAKSVSAPNDAFYMTIDAAFAWHYYAPRLGLTDRTALEAEVDKHEPAALVDELLARRPHEARVFFVMTHYYAKDGDTLSAVLREFAARGIRVVRSSESTSAFASEIEFSEK
jgi:hypothetical protein